MPTWSSSLLKSLDESLNQHEFWTAHRCEFRNGADRAGNLHLAVFVGPFLSFLLDGRKTIESRFSIHRRAPFECVQKRDIVLIKASGGSIVALAAISDVWYYQLDADSRAFIRSRFGKQLCVEPEFWDSKATACYATLMQFSRVDRVEPTDCWKRDRRGWVVLDRSLAQGSLFPDSRDQESCPLTVHGSDASKALRDQPIVKRLSRPGGSDGTFLITSPASPPEE